MMLYQLHELFNDKSDEMSIMCMNHRRMERNWLGSNSRHNHRICLDGLGETSKGTTEAETSPCTI